jgi:MFS family permease
MPGIAGLLRENANCRRVWISQVVSEAGDHFNNIAALSLIVEATGSGAAVAALLLARAIPALAAGPAAGVALDRYDRRRIMIASDLVRAVFALAFLLAIAPGRAWISLPLSALLMFASPFFSAGRISILPSIASREELDAANSLTQTTQWATQALGALAAGLVVAQWGYAWAFAANAASFLFSAAAIARLRAPGGFRAARSNQAAPSWRDYRKGLAYIRSVPLILGVLLLSVGWAVGGGAAQVLFTLFGEQVFHRGAAGVGAMNGAAGLGLLAGGLVAHAIGRRLDFAGYRRAVWLCYFVHGGAFIVFSLAGNYIAALLLLALSRVGMSIVTVLNYAQLLRSIPDEFRGRVFATMETVRWPVMALSMAAAGLASSALSPRAIGVVAGLCAALTAAAWAWAAWRGRLPEPPPVSG